MGYKKQPNSTFSRFLSAVLMAGGTPSGGTDAVVSSISTPLPVVEGNDLVFNVTLDKTTPSAQVFTFGITGSGTYPAVAGTNFNPSPTFTGGVEKTNSYLAVPAGILTFDVRIPTIDAGFLANPVTLTLSVATVSAIGEIDSIAEVWTLIPGSAGITIPVNFIGVHHHATYSSLQPNIDSVPFKAYRTHNYQTYGTSAYWSDIEENQGSNDYTDLDSVINAHYARGDDVMYSMYSTPKWAAMGPEGCITWQAGVAHSVPATYTQLDYLYDTVVGCTMRYACVQAGTSGSTEPNWKSLPGWPSGISGVWRADNGGEYVMTKTGHLQFIGAPVYVEGGVYAGIHNVTAIIDANSFTIASTSNLGNISASVYLCILDGTVIWRQSELPKDPNYHRGGNNPWFKAAADTHIANILNRYNTGGIHKIKIIEVGNEPEFSKTNIMFFNGSAGQLVDMVWHARQAAIAIDPTVKVIPAGFTYNSSIFANATILQEYLAAVGPVSGKHGWETLVDGMSFHAYGATWLNGIWDSPGVGNASNPWGIKNIRDSITAAGGNGATTPVYMSEGGPFSQAASKASFVAMSNADRKTSILTWLMFFAGCGVKQYYFYQYEGYDTRGISFGNDLLGSTAALVDFNTLFAGQTIDGAYYSNGKGINIKIGGVDNIYHAPASMPTWS